MFLSFIIPIYNTEKYVAECIEACESQDIAAEDYEVICVNDGSTDRSLSIVKECAERYSNIVVIDKPNGGVSSARNAGLEVARGDYIWFVDSDDFVKPNCLGELRTLAQTDNADRLKLRSYIFNEVLSEDEKDSIDTLQPNTYLSQLTMSLYKRAMIDADKLRFMEGVSYGEDTVFLTRIVQLAKNNLTLERVYYFYRSNESSVTHNGTKKANDKRLYSFVKVAKETKKLYDAEEVKSTATANDLMFILHYAMVQIAGRNDEKAKEALKELKAAGLFPMKKLPEATEKNAYTTTRTDAVGKLYNWACMNSHNVIGFASLKLWYAMYSVVKS